MSTVLFLIGYGLALPAAWKMQTVVQRQHRLALLGHQFGLTLAILGWLLRGSVAIAVIHLAWAVGVRIWFGIGRPRPVER